MISLRRKDYKTLYILLIIFLSFFITQIRLVRNSIIIEEAKAVLDEKRKKRKKRKKMKKKAKPF